MTEVLILSDRGNQRVLKLLRYLRTCALGNPERFKNVAKVTHLVGDKKRTRVSLMTVLTEIGMRY